MYKQPKTGHDTFQVATNQQNVSTIYQNNPQNTPGQNKYNNTFESYQNQLKAFEQEKETVNTEESIKNWFISMGLFVGAFTVYIIVWVIQKYGLKHEVTSHYYYKAYNWSSSMIPAYQIKVPMTPKSVALQLLLQWIMWKGPLMLFTYNCVKLNQGMMKWILVVVSALVLLTVDIFLTVFLLHIYNHMIYFGFYSLITIIVAAVANLSIKRVKEAVLDSLLPLLCIALLVLMQVLILPLLYWAYFNKIQPVEGALFLTFYTYPFIDVLMLALMLIMGNYTSRHVRTFYSQIHYLLIGYQVGFILLVGYTEVEFYYLISYLIFRNIFCSWVMWRWDNVLKLPPVLPGWGVAYYFSYGLMFLPFSGIGNIIIGVGFYSTILVTTPTLLYPMQSSLYANDLFTPSLPFYEFQINYFFRGYIFKIAALIIWIGSTFSHRYSKKMPEIANTVVYNIFGIYLFYLGLSAGLSAPSLTANSLVV